jgi:hypothetical protein
MPITLPFGPTNSVTSKETSPMPQPRSRTRIPRP